MSKWLSFFRVVVIKPLPNQVVEDIDVEPDGVAKEQDLEISALLVPGEPCCKNNRTMLVEAKSVRHVPSDAWGRYPPHMRYNCDQVLFNSDTAGGRHFGTLQVCLHAGACTSQPPLTMIFQVLGPKDLTQEFPRYHPGVRVLWNRTGYMDRKEAMSWAKEVVVPFLEQKHPGDRQVLLLQDSFPASRTCEFVRPLQGIGVEIAYGPKNQSKFWQPIDAGRIGEVLKKLAMGRVREVGGNGVQSRCTRGVPAVPQAVVGEQQNDTDAKTNFDHLDVWPCMGSALDVEVEKHSYIVIQHLF